MKIFASLAITALLLSGCADSKPKVYTDGKVIGCNSINHQHGKDVEVPCLGDGSVINIDSLRGPMILNVWGSWCGPCQDEIPLFVDFYSRAKGKVTLVGIDVEEAQVSDGRHFVETRGITWPNLYDKDGQTASIIGPGVPVTYFVDAKGATVYTKIGVITSVKELEELTRKYLGISI